MPICRCLRRVETRAIRTGSFDVTDFSDDGIALDDTTGALRERALVS